MDDQIPANIYLFRVDNINIRREICSNLIINTQERRQLRNSVPLL